MKNKIFKGIALGIITVIVIACNPKKEETAAEPATVDTEQIKADLQVMENAFADAVNSGKPETIVYYAEDATSYAQNKSPLVGKTAIDKSIKEENVTMPKGSKVTYTVNEVHPSIDGNMVVEFGSYKVIDSTDAVKANGNYMSLFHKKDGKYVCVRDMSASILPAEKKIKKRRNF
jgi:ketosteroid isomerase-like protein